MPTNDDTLNNKSGAGWFARVLAMPNETPQKMLIVAVSLCLVCSVLVSSAAVFLRPLQESNKVLDRKKNILQVAGLLEEDKSIEELFSAVDTKVVDLDTGEYVESIDPGSYDQRDAAKNPNENYVIPAKLDIAKIKSRAKKALVYLVKGKEGRLKSIILPVHGYGLWSTMYGFVALEGDGQTIAGISFYEHAETPGLGGEVDNPQWRRQWQGKLVYDDTGKPRIEVVKGTVDPTQPTSKYQVDGLAGATLTSNGVTNLMRYWFGDNGFGPYLTKLRAQGG